MSSSLTAEDLQAGNSLPAATNGNIIQFIALIASQLVVTSLYVAAYLIIRRIWPTYVNMSQPNGAVARANGAREWLRALWKIDEDDIRRTAGVDGVLNVRRLRMQMRLCAVLFGTALPLLPIYGTAGGNSTDIFARIALTNVLSAETVDGWRIWAAVLVIWINTLSALRIVDSFSHEVAEFSVSSLAPNPPMNHYALVVTDLPRGTTRGDVWRFFSRVYGPDAVVAVHSVYRVSVDTSGSKPAGVEGGTTEQKSWVQRGVDVVVDVAGDVPVLAEVLQGAGLLKPGGGLRKCVGGFLGSLGLLAAAEKVAAAEAVKALKKDLAAAQGRRTAGGVAGVLERSMSLRGQKRGGALEEAAVARPALPGGLSDEDAQRFLKQESKKDADFEAVGRTMRIDRDKARRAAREAKRRPRSPEAAVTAQPAPEGATPAQPAVAADAVVVDMSPSRGGGPGPASQGAAGTPAPPECGTGRAPSFSSPPAGEQRSDVEASSPAGAAGHVDGDGAAHSGALAPPAPVPLGQGITDTLSSIAGAASGAAHSVATSIRRASSRRKGGGLFVSKMRSLRLALALYRARLRRIPLSLVPADKRRALNARQVATGEFRAVVVGAMARHPALDARGNELSEPHPLSVEAIAGREAELEAERARKEEELAEARERKKTASARSKGGKRGHGGEQPRPEAGADLEASVPGTLAALQAGGGGESVSRQGSGSSKVGSARGTISKVSSSVTKVGGNLGHMTKGIGTEMVGGVSKLGSRFQQQNHAHTPAARAAIVVLDTLARASAAVSSPLLVAGGDFANPGEEWNIFPAPEPRDILWSNLEELPPVEERERVRAVGRVVYLGLMIFWSFLIGGLSLVVRAALALITELPSEEVRALVAIVSGIVPFLLQNALFVLMFQILDILNYLFGGAWTRSALAESSLKDYALFLRLVAFMVPLVTISLFDTLLVVPSHPTALAEKLSHTVPTSAYAFMSYVFMRTCVTVNDHTGAINAGLGVLLRFISATTTARRDTLRPPAPRSHEFACWDCFVLLVALTYAPIAPLTAGFCLLYSSVARLASKHELGTMAQATFDSRGYLAQISAKQAMDNVAIAATVHAITLAVGGVAGNVQVIALLPLPIPIWVYRKRMARRQTQGVHGIARGRLPLADAADVDSKRPRDHVEALHLDLGGVQRCWAPPCAPALAAGNDSETVANPAGASMPTKLTDDVGPTAISPVYDCLGEMRQEQLSMWLRRHEDSHALDYHPPPAAKPTLQSPAQQQHVE